MKKIRTFFSLILLFSLPLFCYVGPGAGVAFVGSFFFIFVAFFLAAFNFLTFPTRALLRFIKRARNMKKAKFNPQISLIQQILESAESGKSADHFHRKYVMQVVCPTVSKWHGMGDNRNEEGNETNAVYTPSLSKSPPPFTMQTSVRWSPLYRIARQSPLIWVNKINDG